MHPKARTTPVIRAKIVELVRTGEPVSAVARRFEISRQTVYKWLGRHAEGGAEALADRQPIARRFPSRISIRVQRQIERLRRARRLLAWQIASVLDMARSTVIKVLKRMGLPRLSSLDLPPIRRRYEYRRPGELVHIDIKKLARFEGVGHRIHGDPTRRSRRVGYDVVYVATDDASRYTYAQIYEREDGPTAAKFLRWVIAQYTRRGVQIERVMTDNGKVFTSFAFDGILADIGAKHILTPPFTPWWNGKAERFIQTLLREWAYAIAYRSSQQRGATLPAWLRYYNQERQHSALNYATPAHRWAQTRQ
jgi:transposase InsO family protein